jgi:hypothetical protein
VRRAWLCGSLPGTTPAEAIELALSRLGRHLLFVPGGETSRPNWAATITQRLAETDLFAVAKPGEYTDYKDLLVLSPTTNLDKLDLGYYDQYLIESEVARRLCRVHGLACTFQMGMVSPFDQSMITVGPGRHLRYRRKFEAATLRDIMRIHMADETVIFQLEAPYELCGALKAPSFVRQIVTRRMVANLTHFVQLCPPGLRIGIHPCLGDLNHQAMGELVTLAPLIDWVNELCDQWPDGYTLAYVQLPLCPGDRPPVLDPGWYTDLKRLRVPAGTRVVLGMCHEGVATSDLWPILTLADSLLARAVDVGASCGLALRGNRTLDDVHKILDQQAELCDAPTKR